MIKYIQHTEIDYKKWDACIDQALNGNIYAYSWYLDAACEQWDALIEGDYDTVMPLPYRNKLLVYYIFPPNMIQQLGVYSQKNLTENKITEFIQCIPAKFKYSEINFNYSNPINSEKHSITPHVNLELNLNAPYSELYANYSENIKRSIKKAYKTNFHINRNAKIKDLIQLFKEIKEPELKSLPKDFYPVVERVTDVLLKNNKAQVWKAEISGVFWAGVLFAFSHNKVYFLFSVTNFKAQTNGIMPAMINAIIEENAEKDMIFDFEGSDNINLARFYKSFGATEKNYNKLVINNIPNLLFAAVQTWRKK